MKKIYLLFLTCCSVIAFTFSPSLALQNFSNNIITIKHTEAEIEKDRANALEQLKNSYNSCRMDEIIYDWRYVGKQKVIKKPIGYAANQKRDGTVFTTTGGFYWQDGGYKTPVNFALNLGYGPVSVSMNIARGSCESTGKWITSPYINKPCKLYIYKDVEITSYAVYSKQKYTGEWTFNRYAYTSVDTQEYLEVRLTKN